MVNVECNGKDIMGNPFPVFFSTVLPLFGINWQSVVAVTFIFGILHLESGRKYFFAAWYLLMQELLLWCIATTFWHQLAVCRGSYFHIWYITLGKWSEILLCCLFQGHICWNCIRLCYNFIIDYCCANDCPCSPIRRHHMALHIRFFKTDWCLSAMSCVGFALHIHSQQNLQPKSRLKMRQLEKKMIFFRVVGHLWLTF